MRLKILETNCNEPSMLSNYRGLGRLAPYYVGNIDDEHEANRAFYHYIDKADLMGVVQDVDFCRHVVEAYKSLKPPHEFEIVEITLRDESPESSTNQFLGFDVAYVYRISLLASGLVFDHESSNEVASDDLIRVMRPLFRLIEAHFRPKLNKNGLFDDHNIAGFFLDNMMALQKIRPNLWEGDDCQFKVIGLWKVIN